MCNYIKDDGEQCGIDDHDGPFCHHHHDTRYAELWRRMGEVAQETHSGSQSGSSKKMKGSTCDYCGEEIEPYVRLYNPPQIPRKLTAEVRIGCDCHEERIYTNSTLYKENVPDGWWDE